jgi:D-alanine-D-alanine ligase-like ATP-grasp enzyme
MAQISLKAAKILDLQVAGVDLLFDQQSKRYGLLEVNRAPGFTTDLQLSPELPAVAAFLKKAVTF